MRKMFWITGLIALAVTGLWSPTRPVMAQAGTTNLLVNGGLERPYYGTGVSTRTAPQGWNLWVGAGAPEAFPHNDRVQVRDGEVSWNLHQGYVAFTAAGWQRVTGLKKGDAVTLTAYGWVYTCNDTQYSCIIPDPPYRRSDTSAGAQLKAGIDPTGGTDPNSPNVRWSPVVSPYDQWAEMRVSATAEGDAVTVFLYMTQARGLAMNDVYWDQISLVGGAGVGTAPGATPIPPTAYEVPFVVPQGVQPDGSIVHIVQEGDTLSSIAYAYREYGVTNASIAKLNPPMKPNTAWLRIGQKIIILPPGSVDPTTGKLLNGTPLPTTTGTQTGTPGTPRPTLVSTPIPTPTPIGTKAAADSSVSEAAAAPANTEAPSFTPESITVESNTVPLGAPPGDRTDNPAVTEEAALENAAAPSAAPTDEPTPTVEPTDAPTQTPTEEPTQAASPTAQAVAAVELAAATGTLCVTVFEDANTNTIRDEGEPTLPGATITLTGAGMSPIDYPYAGDDPLCLDVEPGQYRVTSALDGYGLTTGAGPMVIMQRGQTVHVRFGWAQGYVPPAVPTAVEDVAVNPDAETGAIAPSVPSESEPVDVAVQDESGEEKSTLDRLYDYSGLIVLGLAGVIVVGGVTLLFVTRRFGR